MISLLSLSYILEEYVYSLDNLLEELNYYNTSCHKEVGKSRVPNIQRSSFVVSYKYTLTDLLDLINPETQHEVVNLGPPILVDNSPLSCYM